MRTTLAMVCGLSLGLVAGCTTTSGDRLQVVQLNDEDFVNVSQVRAIQFVQDNADPPYHIWVRHAGTPDSEVVFYFGTLAEAKSAWRRLVAGLGGSIQDANWRKEPAEKITTTEPAVDAQAPAANGGDQYDAFRFDVATLGACHKVHLITDTEYARGLSNARSDFAQSLASGITQSNGSLFQDQNNGHDYYRQLFNLQADLEKLKRIEADQLLDSNGISGLRSAIIARYHLNEPPKSD